MLLAIFKKSVVKSLNFFFNVYRFYSKKITCFSLEVSHKSNLGERVTVQSGSMIDFASNVGGYSYVGKNCSITKAVIGRYCSIANNVSIGQGEHDLNKVSTNSIFYENEYQRLTGQECIIGNDVWIGVDAIVLRGIVIGNGAVIGANSVVTKSIPAYAVVVGSPARVIKYRFDKNKIEQIEKTQWWKHSPDDAKKIFEGLNFE